MDKSVSFLQQTNYTFHSNVLFWRSRFFLPGSLVFRVDQMFLQRREMKFKAAGNCTGLLNNIKY